LYSNTIEFPYLILMSPQDWHVGMSLDSQHDDVGEIHFS
jgi:hypothetical protein